MPYSPDAIANFFIRGCDPHEFGLTPMKIQKLVYFAHGWHLAVRDSPLISEGVQAWQFGPVIVSLYHSLKEHGDTPVTSPILVSEFVPNSKPLQIIWVERTLDVLPDQKEFTESLLQRIWDIYGQNDAIQLSKMTHEEGSPWDQIRDQFPEILPNHVRIPNDLIRDYFRQKREANLAKSQV